MPLKDADKPWNVASASHFFQTYAFFPNSVLFLYVFYKYLNIAYAEYIETGLHLMPHIRISADFCLWAGFPSRVRG